jgi:hypothetical protein
MQTIQEIDKRATHQLSLLVDMNDLNNILTEVEILFSDMFNQGDNTLFSTVFEDIVSLFEGKFTGFKACDTPYHNLKHTTDVFLAMARLIHGAHTQRIALNEVDVNIGLVAALMHDTGYIQKNSESYGSGAVLSTVHVQRSVAFMQALLSDMGSPSEFIKRCDTIIHCTDLDRPFCQHHFKSDTLELIGQMIAASDLLAQTADRNYIEKLPLLYQEFQEAGVKTQKNELDLIKEAIRFNDYMRHRIARDLGGIDRYMSSHFRERWKIDSNMYQDTIDRTMTYLASALNTNETNYHNYFRRVAGTR